MVCMLLMSVCFYIWGVYYAGVEDFRLHYKFNVIDTTLALSFFPFIFLYFRSLMDEQPLGWRDFLWFLPSLLIGGSMLGIYIYMGDEQSIGYIEQVVVDYRSVQNYSSFIYKVQYTISIVCYYLVFSVQIIFGLKYTVSRIVSYRRRLDDYYSNPEGKSLDNIKATLVATLVLLITFLLGVVEAYFCYQRYPILVYGLMFGYAVVLYYLSYLVIHVEYTAESFAEDLRHVDQEAKERGYATIEDLERKEKTNLNISKSTREEICLQLRTLLDKDKIFLKKDLRIDDIVRFTQANRTYISKLISEEYQCSFSELINCRRIVYAQELALSNPNISHAQIAESSGFTHPSSFSRIFKQYVGVTFKEWHSERFS